MSWALSAGGDEGLASSVFVEREATTVSRFLFPIMASADGGSIKGMVVGNICTFVEGFVRTKLNITCDKISPSTSAAAGPERLQSRNGK